MFYYHGTDAKIGLINLAKCRKRTDFGKGFYLSNKLETAQNWAMRRASLTGGAPTIMRYEINNGVFRLDGMRFDEPTLEWLEFICSNRRREAENGQKTEPRHNYHWVSGPIADDKVVDVVSDYMDKKITADEAVRRAKALPNTFQISLHTSEAISYIDNMNIAYKQLKNGQWTKDWIVENYEERSTLL